MQFLELVKADLEDLPALHQSDKPDGQAGRMRCFMGRPAYLYWSGAISDGSIFN